MLIGIFAQLVDGTMGINNKLPWQCPEYDALRKIDFNFFKQITLHQNIVMGRKTWESIGSKPLPNRNIHFILTTQQLESNDSNIKYMTLSNFKDYINIFYNNNYIIIGGNKIYTQLLPYCDIIYQTIYNNNNINIINNNNIINKIDQNILTNLSDSMKYNKEIIFNIDQLSINKYTKNTIKK